MTQSGNIPGISNPHHDCVHCDGETHPWWIFFRAQTGRLISDRVPGASQQITGHLSNPSTLRPHQATFQRVRGAAMRGLLLLVFLSSLTANGKQDRAADKLPPEKVLQLNRGNFDKALREHKQLLVHFCKSRREIHSLFSADLNRWSG